MNYTCCPLNIWPYPVENGRSLRLPSSCGPRTKRRNGKSWNRSSGTDRRKIKQERGWWLWRPSARPSPCMTA
nr:MAG TPA: hypothetical protein [Caudoviricetes sp.]